MPTYLLPYLLPAITTYNLLLSFQSLSWIMTVTGSSGKQNRKTLTPAGTEGAIP